MENSFNSYGGSVAFQPLVALFSLDTVDFGSALSDITLTLRFNCSLPFDQQNVNRSLRSSYDKFILQTAKPKRTYRRKKGELDIFANADFVSSEEFFPRSKAEYKTRNETYFRDWNLCVLNILISEFVESKNKFKKSDDFDFDACLSWMKSLSQKMPVTRSEADALIERLKAKRTQERSKLSDWEMLEEDWSDYHSTARDIVSIPVLWSNTDEFAPNGNDTGADVLHFFQEKKSRILNSKDAGKTTFLQEWESMWGESISGLNGDYDNLALNDYRKFTVGFAFAFLRCLGFCPVWLKTESFKHIQEYEAFTEREYPEWGHLKELKAMNKIIVSCLEKAPAQSPN
jgi:hypothetical protein